MQLTDKFGRKISYLRLAVTDRCNLRCQYCMPAAGINIVDRQELLTYKEMYRITRVLSELGVNKVRLTGGEPFVRKDFINFLESLSFNDQLDEINITTNGALISNHIEKLEALKIKSVNLSIDSLHKEKFAQITRRDVFENVFETFQKLAQSNLNLKLNVVVQSGFNTNEIIDFVELSKDKNIAVRFIEEMPFNGKGQRQMNEEWNYTKIINHIQKHYSEVIPVQSKKSSTSKNFKIPTYKGTFGIIPAFTRTICNDCNRIRITATGMFKNCLFDGGVFNVRDFIRKGASDNDLKELFIKTVHHKPENGFIAEAARGNDVSESMSTIGG
ncbi:cyclic pyranopterin monophosphate synthase subunit MoaA [Lutibacter agarilyticus]|uniref:GTP 3',8-cyclase n=1 Tax=Lutibacter agarilyticus TaxID=1109740 RepID=A0A238VSF0_9FLAO|nr:GTP 3',8-cyclase MoaA [Lutibacter agarilyticus]SNR37262.1 cyclic pyranopterin monophosphate synthase subunit MoaA [Lutibacter agarilyticus]